MKTSFDVKKILSPVSVPLAILVLLQIIEALVLLAFPSLSKSISVPLNTLILGAFILLLTCVCYFMVGLRCARNGLSIVEALVAGFLAGLILAIFSFILSVIETLITLSSFYSSDPLVFAAFILPGLLVSVLISVPFNCVVGLSMAAIGYVATKRSL